MVLLWFFFFFGLFESWSPFTTTVLEISATTFSCETPAVSYGLKKLYPTFRGHEGKKIMTEFSLLDELSL